MISSKLPRAKLSVRAMALLSVLTIAHTLPADNSINYNQPSIEGTIFALDAGGQLSELTTNDSSVSAVERDGETLVQIDFDVVGYPNVQFPCPEGGWNLETFRGVELEVNNTGSTAVKVGFRTDNAGDASEQPWNTDTMKLAPGQSGKFQTAFGKSNRSNAYPLDPNRIVDLQIFLINPKEPAQLTVGDLKGYGTPELLANRVRYSSMEDKDILVTPPTWLGQRPPVAGDWVLTLDENFDGDELDGDVWWTRLAWGGPHSGDTQRYTDKALSLKDGMLTIKTEVDPGHQYDEPERPTRRYSAGMLSSYDRWTQCYGYFEIRTKLPTTRGLWPAFWTMPDRGAESGLNLWQRRTTADFHGRGMEIDIFEHLTEWGSGRVNFAAHWDEYGDDHKAWGSGHNYYGPTADGFNTFGLLWEPGKLTWYIDGKLMEAWESEAVKDVQGYLLITLQMGRWATKDVDEANLPDLWEIDHVRVWQLAERMTDQ
ncbi:MULTISPECIES: family 16 glycosylhydrolase [unclassified Lentimonas]|uniref:glycoside hydrolase family 16 protein n=1 Tax=unclassified Lentimonas TaxID=2630993 RepID=UPI0013269D5E|nr:MULTISPECIES: glycoside hydrolase family 16 protein [unclassified Lentimonas]CAA6689502.1 Unannotated [Lentimonas sp. CC10]CAA6691984.1 Unannotated [Lentimonas sp. CC19]CAA7070543.1 Unannotated [Lentimonas sp. CC11]